MANYLSDRTGASIDTVLDNADAGNIGKDSPIESSSDLNTFNKSGFYRIGASSANTPTGAAGSVLVVTRSSSSTTQTFNITGSASQYVRHQNASTWGTWQELYSTGNTGSLNFPTTTQMAFGSPDITQNPGVRFDESGNMFVNKVGADSQDIIRFYRGAGANIAGRITTTGTTTAYTTTSDPRAKQFAEAPTDSAINAEFNSLYSCFRTFNWKSDPQGELVWGFDAHACIDAGTGIGSEGEGSRSLNLGDTYETIPAVTENRVVNDAEGNPTSEIETVVITAAIEKKVSPAGVDQSKAVPILLAKIEQLERRLTLAGL